MRGMKWPRLLRSANSRFPLTGQYPRNAGAHSQFCLLCMCVCVYAGGHLSSDVFISASLSVPLSLVSRLLLPCDSQRSLAGCWSHSRATASHGPINTGGIEFKVIICGWEYEFPGACKCIGIRRRNVAGPGVQRSSK